MVFVGSFGCPAPEALVEGLRDGASPEIEAHLNDCADCSTVAEYVRVFHDDSEAGVLLAGRYRIDSLVGMGAMGSVYRGYDTMLHRMVACKRLHAPMSGRSLVREGQALAQVSHPNVVSVFDVVSSDEDVFVMMEYIDGRTLAQWCAEAPRSSKEILNVLLAAGRGIAAVHDAGLVHRDIKPHNILIDTNERVYVTDFGLAHTQQLADVPPEASSLQQERSYLAGTPAYMAPETRTKHRHTPASDQYAYCLMTWEAFTGTRDTRVAAVGMSRSLRRALQRGVSRDPSARFSTMHELLAALDNAARRRRWTTAGAVVGASVLGAVIWAGLQEPHPSCQARMGRAVDGWNKTSLTALQHHVLAIGGTSATTAWPLFEQALSNYAQDIQGVADDYCATEEQAEGDKHATLFDALQEARRWCLKRARRAATDLIVRLQHVEADDVSRLPAVALALPPLETCLRMRGAYERPQPAYGLSEPVDLHAIAAIERLTDEARALLNLGKDLEGRALLDTAIARSVEGHHAALEARARILYAGMLVNDGSYAKEALVQWRIAATKAQESGDAWAFADAAARLVGHVKDEKERVLWDALAEATLRGLGVEDGVDFTLAKARWSVAHASGKFDTALHYAEQCVAKATTGETRAVALTNLSSTLTHHQRTDEALAAGKHALQLAEGLWPPTHALAIRVRNNLANMLSRAGRHEESVDMLRAVVAATSLTDGTTTALVARENLALSLKDLGQFPEAIALMHEVLAQSAAQDESPNKAATWLNMGNILAESGQPLEALKRYDEAEGMLQRAPSPYMLAHVVVGRAAALRSLGRRGEARTAYLAAQRQCKALHLNDDEQLCREAAEGLVRGRTP